MFKNGFFEYEVVVAVYQRFDFGECEADAAALCEKTISPSASPSWGGVLGTILVDVLSLD